MPFLFHFTQKYYSERKKILIWISKRPETKKDSTEWAKYSFEHFCCGESHVSQNIECAGAFAHTIKSWHMWACVLCIGVFIRLEEQHKHWCTLVVHESEHIRWLWPCYCFTTYSRLVNCQRTGTRVSKSGRERESRWKIYIYRFEKWFRKSHRVQ